MIDTLHGFGLVQNVHTDKPPVKAMTESIGQGEMSCALIKTQHAILLSLVKSRIMADNTSNYFSQYPRYEIGYY